MSDIRRTTTRWTCIVALSAPLAIACDSSQPVSPPLAPESGSFSQERGDRGALSDAALFVGNFTFFEEFFPGPAPTNGILRYDSRGAFIDNMVPEGAGKGTARVTIACCMAFGPDENLYVGSPLTSNVLRFNGVTGAFIDEFIAAGSGGLVAPLVLVFHSGKLYVGDVGSQSIRRYNAVTGAFIDVFVASGSGGMVDGDPQGFVFGPDGNLYVASTFSNQVLRFNGVTGALIDAFIGSDAVSLPGGPTFGPHGDLYVTNNNGVNRYNGKTGTFIDVFVSEGSGGLSEPTTLIFAPDKNLYISSSASGEILRYDRKGRFMDVFVPVGRGGISGPRTIEWKATTIVCHSTAKRDKGKSITIGYLSAPEHLAHGDALGPCRHGREQGGDGH
jgi:WD40 repeat protein